jgi:hypoxanthine phosphoribosyltransferase
MCNKVYYSMQDTRRHLQIINREMAKRGFKPDLMVAISRGGLIPGVYMSHYHHVPLVCLTVDDYKQPCRNIALHQVADALREQKKVLIVDEICDTGKVLRNIWDTLEAMCPELETASNHACKCSVVERNLHTAVLIDNEAEDLFWCDYVGEAINKVENPGWIVFDWEEWWA